jgi:hypothetical protein
MPIPTMIDSNISPGNTVSEEKYDFECLDLDTFEESLDLSILISDEDDRETESIYTASSIDEMVLSKINICLECTDTHIGSLSDCMWGEILEDENFCSNTVVSDNDEEDDDDDKSKHKALDENDDDNNDAIQTAMEKLNECMRRTSETRKLIELTHAFSKELKTSKGAASSEKLKKSFHKRSPQPAIKIKSALSKLNWGAAHPASNKTILKKKMVNNFASTGCQKKLIDLFLWDTARCKNSSITPPFSKEIRAIKCAEKGSSSIVNFLRKHQKENELVLF